MTTQNANKRLELTNINCYFTNRVINQVNITLQNYIFFVNYNK